jgi:hypothetical protein
MKLFSTMPPPIVSPGSQTGGGPVVESPPVDDVPTTPLVLLELLPGPPLELLPPAVVPVALVGSVVAIVALFDSEPALSVTVPVALTLVVGTVVEPVFGSVTVAVATVLAPESVVRPPSSPPQAVRRMPSVAIRGPKFVRIHPEYRQRTMRACEQSQAGGW